jgi:hypothetical protein
MMLDVRCDTLEEAGAKSALKTAREKERRKKKGGARGAHLG